jgi:hypothetical protein
MQKLLVVIVILLMGVALVGCGSNDNDVPAETTPPLQAAQNEPQEATPTPAPPPAIATNPFDAFGDGLATLGFTFETEFVLAQMIGAENGLRFVLSDGGEIEIFEFDANSEVFADIVATNSVILNGFGSFPVIVAGNLVMMLEDIPDEAIFVELLRSIS